MSLFDVIRYPVTTEFKAEDLERIPDKIIFSWLKYLDYGDGRSYAYGKPYLEHWQHNVPDTISKEEYYTTLSSHVRIYWGANYIICKKLKDLIENYDESTNS